MEFNKSQLFDLLGSLYSVTGIKIAIKNNDGEQLFSIPERDCAFCETLRKSSKAIEECDKCEKKHLKICEKEDKLIIYKCHMGLTEAIFPLKINNINIGYAMLGQVIENNFFLDKKEDLLKKSRAYTDKITINDISEITQKSDKQIKDAAKILEACASYLLVKDWIRGDFGGIAFQITNYINDNLDSSLSVNYLCEHFGLSRNMLYKISERYFDMPIAKYIRKKRVTQAVELIKSGISISDAAGFTGFGDYSYFTKVVKKETGFLPSYWLHH